MIKKSLTVALFGLTLQGCSSVGAYHQNKEIVPYPSEKGVHRTMAKEIVYRGVPINGKYGIGVAPANNFYLGANPGLRQIKGYDIVDTELFKRERVKTLARLCKSQYPDLDQPKEIIKKVEVCTLDYSKDIPLKSIYFELGSSEIAKPFKEALDQVAELLKTNKTSILRVSGYTDNVGTMKINKILAKQRADAVYMYLTKHGAPSTRIFLAYKPQSGYLLKNTPGKGMLVNRRVDMIFNFNFTPKK